MKLSVLIALILCVYLTFSLTTKRGWIVIWNGFFVISLLVVLVFSQEYIGKTEGLLIAIIPFIAGQILIKNNRIMRQYYISKQMKFIKFCNKYIYDFSRKIGK